MGVRVEVEVAVSGRIEVVVDVEAEAGWGVGWEGRGVSVPWGKCVLTRIAVGVHSPQAHLEPFTIRTERPTF